LVIVPGLFFTSLQVAHTAVVMKKHVNYYAYICLATGIINVLLSIFLSRLYGAVGSCISISIAYGFRAIALNLLYHKKLRINMWNFAKKCYLRMSLPIVISVLIGALLSNIIPIFGWIGLGIKGALVVVVYLVAVVFVGLNDRKAIINQVKSLLR
ncbi:MAG: polysaccharide biosynthesis C-terminal domain-containing protein, partial [Clostridia bacterium]|nr:polysaccharide biosynthesis C-terminal domain-containing protein [Clostridia bacterium]